jgi:hypothetical protein
VQGEDAEVQAREFRVGQHRAQRRRGSFGGMRGAPRHVRHQPIDDGDAAQREHAGQHEQAAHADPLVQAAGAATRDSAKVKPIDAADQRHRPWSAAEARVRSAMPARPPPRRSRRCPGSHASGDRPSQTSVAVRGHEAAQREDHEPEARSWACVPTGWPTIRIRGARTHNLKNVDLDIPRDRWS